MSKKSYKLIYFRARGRAEFIRLVFLIAGVEFEDHLVDFQQNWPSLKANSINEFIIRKLCVKTTYQARDKEIVEVPWFLCTIFRPVINLKLHFLPYSSRFFYLTFTNTRKREQSDEIRHSSFTSSKPHDAALSGIAPFGQLPLLEITDDSSPKPILLCQSVAIMRYLAIEFGLAPESNLEKALVDMVVDAVMHIRAKIRKCRFTTDATLKEKLLKEFQGALPNDLKNLEKILQANSGGK
ncbi:unnamed protein product [Porites evermanni]|uniref:GST N-terminal domain-containing protein n=1 Tax=Porites evermanni TaxID=104178 RepID=A0ABN8LIM4_9CNID|nr:unnamed protein product [Porites evermanni]